MANTWAYVAYFRTFTFYFIICFEIVIYFRTSIFCFVVCFEICHTCYTIMGFFFFWELLGP